MRSGRFLLMCTASPFSRIIYYRNGGKVVDGALSTLLPYEHFNLENNQEYDLHCILISILSINLALANLDFLSLITLIIYDFTALAVS